ncbi:MAG: pectin acetylesterase-family hydrolase, partial [Candidatus Binatia bacterium]
SYGGPHATVRGAASDTDQKCLDGAWRDGQSLINYALRQQSICIRKVSSGKTCDTAGLATKLAARESATVTKISGKCPTPLGSLVAVDPTVFVARAAAQTRCLVAAAHGQTAPLTLDCGPRAAAPVPARGVDTQIELPFAIWGSRCGDGSNYAFRLRLAPIGSPIEKVVVHMAGGGACLDGPDCAATNPDLFEALTDGLPGNGMMSSTAASNPFRDWTKVSLPYCTQDLHIGGGVPTAYPEITVQRYGALNVRAAMQYMRDVIWAELDATDPEGYRADRPLVIFSGSSAGGYGAAYNYHWMLDDLGWVHTTAIPDAGLAMDNGTPAGVILLGAISLPPTYPGWNTQAFLPPYCFSASCAEIFVNLEAATAPRLLGEPEQQFLHISNQIDDTQRTTTLFPSNAAFVNTLRSSYCDIRGTPGLHSFLRGASMSIHGQLNNANWDNATIDGTVLRDWIGGAMSNPAGVVDRTQPGTLEADYVGVLPFPCALD